jgi:hypothetical protein
MISLRARWPFLAALIAAACPVPSPAAAADFSAQLLREPGLVRYYDFAAPHSPAAPIPDRTGSPDSLTCKTDLPARDFQVGTGHLPDRLAVHLDARPLQARAFTVTNRSFSVAGWVRLDGPGSQTGNGGSQSGTLFSAGDGYWSGWRLTVSYPRRDLNFSLGRPKPSSAFNLSAQPLPEGVWHHVAATWDGAEMRVYVDAALSGQARYSGDYTPPADGMFRIGYANAGMGSVLLAVDSVAVFSRALPEEEVLRLALDAPALPPQLAAHVRAAGRALAQTNRTLAESEWRAAARLPGLTPELTAHARLQTANLALQQNRHESAGQALDELLDLPGVPTRLAQDAFGHATDLVRMGQAGALPPRLLTRVLTNASLTQLERSAARLSLGHRLMGDGKLAAAQAEYQAVASAPELSAPLLTSARLGLARTYELEKNLPAARAELENLARLTNAPAHQRQEAMERLAEMARTERGLPARDPLTSRTPPLKWPKPGRVFAVAPQGSDAAPGTVARPFATLERAREAIRQLKSTAGLPAGGVQVLVRGGIHPVTKTFRLETGDSGTSNAPIRYTAYPGEKPLLRGGVRLTRFERVSDPAILNRLPVESRGAVWQTNLRAHGVTNLIPLRLGGFSSGLGFKTHPAHELFIDGQAQQLARWPNQGFVETANVVGTNDLKGYDRSGNKSGVFVYEGERPARWAAEKIILLYGYWFWDWADSYERVAAIDPAQHHITLAPPFHSYGYRKGAPYYALNLLCELDQPGEWYLDHDTAILYFYPSKPPAGSVVEFSNFAGPMAQLDEVSHVAFEGLTWELGAGDGVLVKAGENCRFLGCTVRHLAGNGIEIAGGRAHGLLACDIHSLGRGGVKLSGGSRKTLEPGGHFVENCHIHDLSRIDHTYTPAVIVDGVGQRVSHNRMHHIGSSAIRLGGDEHLVELNEIDHVVLESDDQGGADMFGNPTFRGNVYRHNFWHHIGTRWGTGGQPHLGQAGIRLDDAISGVLIYGNVFYRAASGAQGFGGVQIHGGKDNILDNNLFVDCAVAVSFSPWDQKRWSEFAAKSMADRGIDPTAIDLRKTWCQKTTFLTFRW